MARTEETLRWAAGSRLACVGTTGSGKSFFARQLFLASAGRRVVIDPFDSMMTVGSWPSITDAMPDFSKADTWRIVPSDPEDRDFYDALYMRLFEQGNVTIWSDELTAVTTSQIMPLGLKRVLFQGRKRRVTHIGCSQRPVGVNPGVWANSDVFVIFRLPWFPDRQTIAASAGIPMGEFERHQGELKKHGFMWWEVAERRLHVFRSGLRRSDFAAVPKETFEEPVPAG